MYTYNHHMFADIFLLTEQINKSTDILDIQNIILRKLNTYGVERVFAGIIPIHAVSPEEQLSHVLFGNWPQEWAARYFQNDYLEQDPTITHLRTASSSLKWNDISKKQSLVMNEASEFQLHDGITIPMISIDGAKLGMSFAGERLSKSPELEQLCYFTSAISTARVLEITRQQHATNRNSFNLTPAEFKCLQWATEGKTNWEIGRILFISERTVEKHIGNCLIKTNSLNRTQLVANGLRHGLIT